MSHIPPDASPWRRPGFIIAAAFLAVLVIGGVIIAITGPGGDAGAEPSARAPDKTGATSPKPKRDVERAGSDGSCSLQSGSQRIPADGPPPATRWVLIGSMAAPAAPRAYGPQRNDGRWRTCYAHSPTGALYAAANFWAAGTAAAPADVYKKFGVPGRTTEQAIRDARRNPGTVDSQARVQIVGYSYLAYDGERATINLAFRSSTGALAQAPTVLLWRDGDWRVDLAAASHPTQLVNLSGFVSWNGA